MFELKSAIGTLGSLRAALLTCIAISNEAFAQDATALFPHLYVGNFRPIEQARSGFGPLHALNTDIHKIKADSNASKLSAALVASLRKRQVQSDELPTQASQRPSSGWCIHGVFYALDEDARLVSVPFLTSRNGPNVEVSVSVADCAIEPTVPFAVIGTKAAIKGQGTAISWNPYVAAAKFVVHQVQGQDSMMALADQIANKIFEQRDELLAHDPVTRAGSVSSSSARH